MQKLNRSYKKSFPQMLFCGIHAWITSVQNPCTDHSNHQCTDISTCPRVIPNEDFHLEGRFCISIHSINFVTTILCEQLHLKTQFVIGKCQDDECKVMNWIKIGERNFSIEEYTNAEKSLGDYIVKWLLEYQKMNNVKFIAAGLRNGDFASIRSKLWLECDILPCCFETIGFTIDQIAETLALQTMALFGPLCLPRIVLSKCNQVLVDSDHIKFASIEDYERTVAPSTWNSLLNFCNQLNSMNSKSPRRIAFINSTFQGGGVALMRHSIARIARLLDLPITWHVMESSPAVFQITKRKFHNVLQGITIDPQYKLTESDILFYEEWCKYNSENVGFAKLFQECSIVVLDDTQTAGLVPHIKKANPDCLIVFRSHIEIETKTLTEENSVQLHNWNYLWKYKIEEADAFVAHPIPEFVPPSVPSDKVYYMPASTDPLDGLNKEMSWETRQFYLKWFQKIADEQEAGKLDISRPYIIQIARFDPSKGLLDVLKAYLELRKMIDHHPIEIPIPQLVICGHGSVDDPEGFAIYDQIRQTMKTEKYKDIREDIIAVALPPSDQILNSLLRESHVALQLSHREGFEVKVTECISKGIPVICYNVGGICKQVEHGINSYLVPVGDIKRVSTHLYNLFSNRELYEQLVSNCCSTNVEEFTSIHNLVNWLALFVKLKTLNEDRYKCTTLSCCTTIENLHYVERYWEQSN